MTLCKILNSSLGKVASPELEEPRFCSLPSPGGLGLIVWAFQKPADMVESAMICHRRNSCGIVGKFYGEGGGFRTCTESLGFESSDERVTGEEGEEKKEIVGEVGRVIRTRLKRQDAKVFPPPLPRLDRSGRTRSFMKAERKGGRLVLKEVRIERPDIFRALREEGRLRLQLMRPLAYKEEDEDKGERLGRWQYGGLQRCNEKGTTHFSGWAPRSVTII